MTAFLTENVLFWAIAAGGLFAFGFALSRGTGKAAFLWGGATFGVLTAILGLFLVFGVETDRKIVRATIFDAAAAVANNDVDGVLERLDPNAKGLRRAVERNLGRVEVEWAKIRDFQILEMNYHTSPPRALVSFRASAGGVGDGIDALSFTVVLHFTEVELRRVASGDWRVAERCKFRFVGGDSEPSDRDYDDFGEFKF